MGSNRATISCWRPMMEACAAFRACGGWAVSGGHSPHFCDASVPDGAGVKVRIGQGQKGPEVTEVIKVDTSNAQMTSATVRGSTSRSVIQRQSGVGATEECIGSVKWYNADKGFGFIGQDGGGKDVFVHATTLERGGLGGLAAGQRVRMQIGLGQKGPEARSIELLD
jgi:CspA family cold shock protein